MKGGTVQNKLSTVTYTYVLQKTDWKLYYKSLEATRKLVSINILQVI